MVDFMENPIKMDDLGGYTTPIFGSTPIWTYQLINSYQQQMASPSMGFRVAIKTWEIILVDQC